MVHDGRDDFLDVVGSHESSTANCRHRLAASEQCDRCTGAASESQVFVVPSLVNNLKQVMADSRIDVNGPNRLLGRDQLFGGGDGGHRINRMFELEQVQHPQLFFNGWVSKREPHQKTVELGFGQREGAFVIDGVLSRDDEEGRIQRVGFSVDRDAGFCHRFQQRGLRSRRGSVDFVGEQDLREHRAGTEFELRVLLVEDRCAGHIGG